MSVARTPTLRVAALMLVAMVAVANASPHLPAYATMPDLRHDPQPHDTIANRFSHDASHEDVFGGTTKFAYDAHLADGTVVIDPAHGSIECHGETEMTVTSDDQELLSRIVRGVVVIGPPEHGCYPIDGSVGHPHGRSVHRGVGRVHKTDRNDTLRLETTENMNPLHMFKSMKLRFDHQPRHLTSHFHTADQHMELYNHEEALRAYSPAPVVDHQAWATRPAGNQSHHELLARQRRGSVTKVFQLPAIEFPLWHPKLVLNAFSQQYEKDAEIRIKLLNKFTASLTFDLDVSFYKGIEHMKFAIGGSTENDFEVKLQATQDISVTLAEGTVLPSSLAKKWGDKLVRLKIATVVIPIGPVVIWFDNELGLSAKFTLHLSPGRSTFGLSFKKSITMGTQYDYGKGFKDLYSNTGPGLQSRAEDVYWATGIELRFYLMPSYELKLFSFIPFIVEVQPWIGLGLAREKKCEQKFGVTINAGLGIKFGLDDITIGLMQLFSDKDELGDDGSSDPWSFIDDIFSIQIPGIFWELEIIKKIVLFGPWCLDIEWPAQPPVSDALAPSGEFENACVCTSTGKSGGESVPNGCTFRDSKTGDDYCYALGGTDCDFAVRDSGLSKKAKVQCLPEKVNGPRCCQNINAVPRGVADELVYIVVTILEGQGMDTQTGYEDYYVNVQARGRLGGDTPLLRKTTIKLDTEDPKWNEKIMFGPLPWDSGIAFQLFESDTVWDDPTPLYISGRQWQCHHNSGDQWVWGRLGKRIDSETLTIYTNSAKSTSGGSFKVKIESRGSRYIPSTSWKSQMQKTCKEQCQDESWSFFLSEPALWCERGCGVYSKDKHHLTSKCEADTCVKYGYARTCDCPACKQGCLFKKNLWKNLEPTFVPKAPKLPGGPPEPPVPEIIGAENIGTGTAPVPGQSWPDCKAVPVLNPASSGYCDKYTEGCCQPAELKPVEIGGKTAKVHRDSLSAWKAFAQVVAKHNYEVRSFGAHCCRCIRQSDGTCYKNSKGEDIISNHAYGAAIDINPSENPMRYNKAVVLNGETVQSRGKILNDAKTALVVDTDMPQAMVDELRGLKTADGSKSIFRWGGDYSSKKDAMHWEVFVSPEEVYKRFGGHEFEAYIPGSECSGRERVHFPSIQLCPVNSTETPAGFENPRSSGAPLFERNTVSSNSISRNFKVNEVAPSGTHFRAEPLLVQCLQAVRSALGKEHSGSKAFMSITTGFTTGAVSGEDGVLEDLHAAGLALDVNFQTPSQADKRTPFVLAEKIIKVCSPLLAEDSVALGLGLYGDHLHVDFRPTSLEWVGAGAVNAEGTAMSTDEFIDQVFLWRNPGAQLQGTPDCTGLDEVAVGKTMPPDETAAEACGEADGQVTRDGGFGFERMVKFRSNNVDINANETAIGTGFMTPRAWVLLRVLAKLVEKEWPDTKLALLASWNANPDDVFDAADLQFEGRTLKVKFSSGGSGDLGKLSMFAVCAGFNHVARFADHLMLSVSKQKGRLSRMAVFPSASTLFLEVDVPHHVPDLAEIYSDPHASLEGATPLYDGFNRADEMLSEPLNTTADDTSQSGFWVSSFLPEGRRYFRLPDYLLQCLQEVEDQARMQIADSLGVKVLYGYLTKFDEEPPVVDGVLRRHRSGRGLEIGAITDAAGNGTYSNQTVSLVNVVVDKCVPHFHDAGYAVAVGLYERSVYFDARLPTEGKTLQDPVTFVGEGAPMVAEAFAEHVKQRVVALPRLIEPFNLARACAAPAPQRQSIDFVWRDPDEDVINLFACTDDAVESAHCKNTEQLRHDYNNAIWDELVLVGVKSLPEHAKIQTALADCILPCNACNKGVTMLKKAKACDEFIHWAPLKFIDRPDKSHFYVLDNTAMGAIACQDGNFCIKSTPIFGAVYEAIDAIFTPDPTLAQKEKVFSPEDNPSPIVELIHKLYAMHVRGTVNVHVADAAEVSALAPVLRIVMAWNENVDKVVFNAGSADAMEDIVARISGLTELWRGNVCPVSGRSHTALYEVQLTSSSPPDRRRRRRSEDQVPEHHMEFQDRHDAWEFAGII